jgi:hypothetical protein
MGLTDLSPLVAAGLVAQAIVIIGSVHWSNGFFNARSGQVRAR